MTCYNALSLQVNREPVMAVLLRVVCRMVSLHSVSDCCKTPIAS